MSEQPMSNRDTPTAEVFVLFIVYDEKQYIIFSTLEKASKAYHNHPVDVDGTRDYLGIEKRPLDTGDLDEPEYESCEPLSPEEC